MQAYYANKLKCLIFRLMAGSAVILTAGSIIISIIKEIRGSYDPASRMAYILGLVLCGLLILIAVFLMWQGLRFERTIFRRKKRSYDLTEYEDEAGEVMSCGSFILTDRCLLIFSTFSLTMCRVVPLDTLIGCFECPEYENLTDTSDYALRFYDHKLREYALSVDKGDREKAHAIYERACALMPWLFSEKYLDFEDKMGSRSGRKSLIKEAERRRYVIENDVDAERDADTELDEMRKETGRKLDMRGLLNRRPGRKTKAVSTEDEQDAAAPEQEPAEIIRKQDLEDE